MKLQTDQNQVFNDGVVVICSEQNTAEDGDMPKIELVELYRLRFREMTNSITRRFEAKSINVACDRTIRVPYVRGVKENMTAKVTDCDAAGVQYRISNVDKIMQNTPPTLTLTLERTGDHYEV